MPKSDAVIKVAPDGSPNGRADASRKDFEGTWLSATAHISLSNVEAKKVCLGCVR